MTVTENRRQTVFTDQHVAKGYQPGPIYWSASAITPTTLLNAVGGEPLLLLPNHRIAQTFDERATVFIVVSRVGVLTRQQNGDLGGVRWLSPGDDPGQPDGVRFEGTVVSLTAGTVNNMVPLAAPFDVRVFAYIGGGGDEFAGRTTHMWFQLTDQAASGRTIESCDLTDLLYPH